MQNNTQQKPPVIGSERPEKVFDPAIRPTLCDIVTSDFLDKPNISAEDEARLVRLEQARVAAVRAVGRQITKGLFTETADAP